MTALEVVRAGRDSARAREDRAPAARACRLQHGARRVAERLSLETRIYGEAPKRPSILVANHLSYLDPIAVAQAMPISAIAKAEVHRWPGIGRTLADLGILFVRRGDPAHSAVALRKAMRLLDAGVSVLVFPEGTTTWGDEVLPFQRGVFGVAAIKAVPVAPIALRYDSRDLCWVGDTAFAPHFLRLHRYRRMVAHLHFASAIEPGRFTRPEEAAEEARLRIRGLLRP
ncbi:MAG: lysophospholipid acyltransferase family protein [Myxococcota bacterium]